MSDYSTLVCRSTQPEAMQISDCLVPSSVDSYSAIDEFESSIAALAKTAGNIPKDAGGATVTEMLIVAAVASTETYFRTILSKMASICPFTSENVQDEQITLGAVRAYPLQMHAFALVERTLFSSKGTIEGQLRRFTRYAVPKGSELQAAITAFESACTCRHSLVHWRGHLDSSTSRALGLEDAHEVRYKLDPSYALFQRVLAACDHVVHVANKTLFDFTLDKWLSKQYIELTDAESQSDQSRLRALIEAFGSTKHVDNAVLLATLHQRLLDEVVV